MEEANSTERKTALKNGHHFLDHLKATGLGEFFKNEVLTLKNFDINSTKVNGDGM